MFQLQKQLLTNCINVLERKPVIPSQSLGQSEDKDIRRGLLVTDLTHFQRAPKVLKSTICYKSKYELKATLEM